MPASRLTFVVGLQSWRKPSSISARVAYRRNLAGISQSSLKACNIPNELDFEGNSFQRLNRWTLCCGNANMTPLVSILIPCYNAERWIAQAVQSALAQTWAAQE